MKKHMTRIVALLAAACGMVACQEAKFQIKGAIAGAQDSVLYFEHMSLEGPVVQDSVKLDAAGNFAFDGDAPEAPEFYRLRIGGQMVNLSVDSTETITVKADYATMSTAYEVQGSDNCTKIKELALKQMDLQQRAIAVSEASGLSMQQASDSIGVLVERYKDEVKRDYIFKEPMKAYAYFALFQTLGNRLLFDPRGNKEDNKVYGAVGTSWNTYYPHSLRGQNLYNIAIEGMKNQRIIEARQNQQIDPEKVNTTNVLDIELVNNKGQISRLTDLKGKVVLLDFHIFAMKESPQRIMQLREYYNKYHDRGLEIYQVSLDTDEHFWKTQTAALPWVSVRAPESTDDEVLRRYNVQSIPTYFLLDKEGTPARRDVQIQDLDAEIARLL